MTATQSTTRLGRAPATAKPMWLLFGLDAGLLITSGLIHLHLWDIAYRNVKTLGVLFLIQVVATLLAALALLISRHLLVALGSAALMAGTIAGFLLVRTVGLFGFKLPFTSGLAYVVLVVEAVAVVTLGLTSWLLYQQRRS